jgi:hypothetical protein
MGLSFHFTGRLRDAESLPALIEEVYLLKKQRYTLADFLTNSYKFSICPAK